jgi:hypothetical protein
VHLWFRLYTHALLLESRNFPSIELCDESLDYTPFGFADIWKGNYLGGPVCIKAVWGGIPTHLEKVKAICSHFIYRGRTERASYKTFRRGRKPTSHPNVLPIIDVSETLSPFYIMSSWMPNGNITQYTQGNSGANRLILVRAR